MMVKIYTAIAFPKRNDNKKVLTELYWTKVRTLKRKFSTRTPKF